MLKAQKSTALPAAVRGVSSTRKVVSKFIWELTVQDLSEHAIWLFPHSTDDSIDETIVTPATKSDVLDPNTELLVKAQFTDAIGNKYLGYMKTGLVGIEYTQPCMFSDGESIGFWFGISKPNLSDLPKLHFPISVVSESLYGLPSQVETLKGFGYVDTITNQIGVMYS